MREKGVTWRQREDRTYHFVAVSLGDDTQEPQDAKQAAAVVVVIVARVVTAEVAIEVVGEIEKSVQASEVK